MVAHIVQRVLSASAGLDTPAGWTKLNSDQTMGSPPGANSHRSAAFYKVADAGDVAASDFTWTFAGGTAGSSTGAIQAYYNIETATPVDASSTMQGTANTNSIDATAVTTNYTNDMIVAVYGEHTDFTFTPPGGCTERYDFAKGNQLSAMGCDMIQAAAGSTGVLTATLTGNDNRRTAKVIALRKNTVDCP
jgi:hypothetical protein